MIINDVSKKYNISTRTLRYYEQLGLITSNRSVSNHRDYDEQQLQLLEEILTLKLLNLKLQDIKMILQEDSRLSLRQLLHEQLTTLDHGINDLKYKRQLIHSVLQTFGSEDFSKANLEALLREQIFFRSSEERWSTMLNENSHITIDIGENLIPLALDEAEFSIVSSIKSLRSSLKKDYNINLDKIRLKDNIKALSPNEFQILVDDDIVVKKTLLSTVAQQQVDQIMVQLKALLI